MSNHQYLINGSPATALALTDRAIHYGDGCFTTLRVQYGEPCAWPYHLERLQHHCHVLDINFSQWAQLEMWLTQALKLNAALSRLAGAKIIISRGSGGRGYSPAECEQPTVIISVLDYPAHYVQWQRQGIALGELTTRLSLSSLAGLKHLNRLEQVLAKREIDRLGIDDGVMCDFHGAVVETSCANLFWRQQNKLYTPKLTHAGVAGTMRAQVMAAIEATPYQLIEIKTGIDALTRADEIMICNALMGIVPVNTFRDRTLSDFSVTQLLQTRVS